VDPDVTEMIFGPLEVLPSWFFVVPLHGVLEALSQEIMPFAGQHLGGYLACRRRLLISWQQTGVPSLHHPGPEFGQPEP
jgi:hypothetical protein